MSATLILGLVWVASGTIFIVSWLVPFSVDFIIFPGIMFLAVLSFAKNIVVRKSVLPARPGFWSYYLIIGAILVLMHIAFTAIILDHEKDWYQVGRRLFFFSFYLLVPYVLASSNLDHRRLTRHLFAITVVLAGLDLLSILSGQQLFISSFGSYSGWDGIEAVLGNIRLVPLGIEASLFAGFIAVLQLSDKAHGQTLKDRALLYVVVFSSLAILLLSFSRSLISAVALSLLAWLIFSREMSFRKKSAIAFRWSVVLFAATLMDRFTLEGAFFEVLTARFGRAVEVGDSWRALELDEAWQTLSTSPFIGIGLGTGYTQVLSGLADEGYAPNANYDLHNLFVGLLVNFGLLGFAYFAVGVAAYFGARRTAAAGGGFSIAAKLLLSTGLLEGIFSGGFINGRAAFWFALLLSMAVVLRVRSRDDLRPLRPLVRATAPC